MCVSLILRSIFSRYSGNDSIFYRITLQFLVRNSINLKRNKEKHTNLKARLARKVGHYSFCYTLQFSISLHCNFDIQTQYTPYTNIVRIRQDQKNFSDQFHFRRRKYHFFVVNAVGKRLCSKSMTTMTQLPLNSDSALDIMMREGWEGRQLTQKLDSRSNLNKNNNKGHMLKCIKEENCVRSSSTQKCTDVNPTNVSLFANSS